MILDILETPIQFIKENLTGWVILIFIIIIIYFVGLRNYYTQKERFYDQSQYEKNAEELEETEEHILEEEDKTHTTTKHTKNNKKPNAKHNTKSNPKNNNTKSKKISPTTENFANNTATPTTTTTTTPPTAKPAATTVLASYISTTLFDNLNLSTPQLQAIKLKYNDVIAQYVIDLGKLVQQQNKNRFLNTQKQFDLIMAKGIDTIINYLNDTIKSANRITRTSIRSEVLNTLTDVLEILITKTNDEISKQSSILAVQNSTTIDYSTQLKEITRLRAQLDEYFEINKLVSNFSHKTSTTNTDISSILDKSFILPIYEQNYNKLQQLVNSDFNGDENNMADKYSKAYMEFLEKQKKDELNINPLTLASQIESGLVSLITGKSSNTITNTEQFQKYNNPIPIVEKQLLATANINQDANIIRDTGNRGSYLINKTTQLDILEGFENTNANNNISKAIKNYDIDSNSNVAGNNTKSVNGAADIVSNLLSGNFVQYIMNYINEKLQWFYGYYNSRMGYNAKDNTNGNGNSNANGNTKFNLEDNMIPAGFLFLVLSMLIYFIDITA